jgi:hypothetical protein
VQLPLDATLTTWGIALVATGGVIFRPRRLPEALWAVLGASALVENPRRIARAGRQVPAEISTQLAAPV